MDDSYIINKIDTLCKERGWTHYRLAKASGIPQSTLHNMLKRNTVLSVPSIAKVCSAFNITLSQFFDEDENYYISEDEKLLIEKYRKLDEAKQKMVFAYIQGLSDI